MPATMDAGTAIPGAPVSKPMRRISKPAPIVHMGQVKLLSSQSCTAGTWRLTTSHLEGDRLEVKVEAGPSFVPFLGPSQGVWRFQLTQEIPLTLRVEAGASSLNIDLKDVLASHVELNTGASSSNVTVPARGVSLLDIDAGAASVNIRVPEATAARIRVEEGVNSVNVDTKRFPRLDSGFYQSTGYDTAPDRADINIQAGLGSVTVR